MIDVLEKVATEHPELNKLELRDNELSDLSFVPRLLENCVTLSILDLRGNSVTDNDIQSITEGLKNNIDMRTILFDHNEKNGQTDEGKALREAMIHELKLNFFCDVFISPKAIELPEMSSGRGLMRVDLSDEPNLNLEALCKYLALKDVLELSLKRTKLTAKLLKQLVKTSWSKMPQQKRMMVKLDLSENPDLDCDSCYLIESIHKNLPFLTTLNLSSTSIKSEGLLIILDSLKTSLTLGCLMLDNCKIDMQDQADYKQVVEKLSINCGLTILGLAGNSICKEGLA